jgi:hypothetical protein
LEALLLLDEPDLAGGNLNERAWRDALWPVCGIDRDKDREAIQKCLGLYRETALDYLDAAVEWAHVSTLAAGVEVILKDTSSFFIDGRGTGVWDKPCVHGDLAIPVDKFNEGMDCFLGARNLPIILHGPGDPTGSRAGLTRFLASFQGTKEKEWAKMVLVDQAGNGLCAWPFVDGRPRWYILVTFPFDALVKDKLASSANIQRKACQAPMTGGEIYAAEASAGDERMIVVYESPDGPPAYVLLTNQGRATVSAQGILNF